MPLLLTILSPERRLLERAQVEDLTLTGSEGEIQILPGHAPMIGTLETGPFRYRESSGGETVGVISSGFFEVKNDEVSLMAETLELRGEIDVNRAKKSQSEAEEMLRQADLDEHSFKKYQLQLERSIIRQQIATRAGAE
jgi:F-type H+-transporting ATPase subunit epsilon